MFPKIMGILNATPDSFSDGTGIEKSIDELFYKTKDFIENGADIIDVGGESTRPGSKETPVEIELQRVLPIVKKIKSIFPNIIVSVDTRKAEVAEETLKVGADIINDVSGLQFNPEIASIVAKYNKHLIIMHSKYLPENMQDNPQYDNVVQEVFDFLIEKIEYAKNIGVQQITADIGIGFAKTTAHNIELLNNINFFEKLQTDLLLGISRKKFIGEISGITNPKERDISTMFIHSQLLKQTAIKIIRVHNVALATQLKNISLLFI